MITLPPIHWRDLVVLGIMMTAQAQRLLARSDKRAVSSLYPTPSPRSLTNESSNSGNRAGCLSGHVSIDVVAENVKLDFIAPNDTVQVTQDLLSFVEPGSIFPQHINRGSQNVSGTYKIFFSLCLPQSDNKVNSVQFLTHGLGFDHMYWSELGYSYVDAALAAGYATFSYDRLGYGRSSKPDPVDVVQAPMHVAIAKQLLLKLKSGGFANRAFSHLSVVGHSYGSIITEALTADSTNPIDAAIFTGFSLNFTSIGEFLLALNLDNARKSRNTYLRNLPPGYLAPTSAIGWQLGFFTAPYFDPKIPVELLSSDGILTFGELFSRGAITKPTTNFTGPVLVVNGDSDLPYCGGNCSFPTDRVGDALKTGFPLSRNTSSYILPQTGHGVNLHLSAREAYDRMLAFLQDNGI